MVRPSGKVSSTVASASTMIPTVITRPTTRTWVRARRARRLSGVSTSRRRISASSETRTVRSASHAPATTSATTSRWLSGEFTLGSRWMVGSVNHTAVSATTIRAGQRQRACSSRARTRSFMTRRISRQSKMWTSSASATTIAATSTRGRPVPMIPSMCPGIRHGHREFNADGVLAVPLSRSWPAAPL
jgi:hypothetical protein